MKHPNAAALWTAEEEKRLLAMFEAGYTADQISAAHGRSTAAILTRLCRKGKLYNHQGDYYHTSKPYYSVNAAKKQKELDELTVSANAMLHKLFNDPAAAKGVVVPFFGTDFAAPAKYPTIEIVGYNKPEDNAAMAKKPTSAPERLIVGWVGRDVGSGCDVVSLNGFAHCQHAVPVSYPLYVADPGERVVAVKISKIGVPTAITTDIHWLKTEDKNLIVTPLSLGGKK